MFLRREFFRVKDPFACLGLERRPWLDPALLEQHFRNRAAQLHPDQKDGDNAGFIALLEARKILADPALRLACLSHREPRGFPSDQIAAHFSEVGKLLQDVREQLARPPGREPLLRAVQRREMHRLLSRLITMEALLVDLQSTLEARICELDQEWPAVAPDALLHVATDCRFTRKWLEQIRESIFQVRENERILT